MLILTPPVTGAALVANVPISLLSGDLTGLAHADVISASATSLVLMNQDGTETYSFFGNHFAFDADHHPIAGTVTDFNFAIGADLALFINLARANLPTLAADVFALDYLGFTSDLLLRNDLVVGSDGSDTLSGFDGNDTVAGQGGDDVLYGDAGRDILTGGDGADTLTGGAGNDTLFGDDGADRFVIDAGRDVVMDLGLGGADALVVQAGAGVTASLAAAWAATAATSNAGMAMLLAGGFSVDLGAATGPDGWSVSNAGNADAVTLAGSAHADRLTGGAGADSLAGADGDMLAGGLGADRFTALAGMVKVSDLGLGADTLMVAAGARALATLGGDWVAGAASSNAGMAKLMLAGHDLDLSAATGPVGWSASNAGNAAFVSLTGSAGADNLAGGDGFDTLAGGLGRDTLAGGGGPDAFLWHNTAEGGDRVTDFVHGLDHLLFSAGGFGGGLMDGESVAIAGILVAGLVPNKATGEFLYNAANGALYWDVDGTGVATKVLIATLQGNPPLSAGDIQVIA